MAQRKIEAEWGGSQRDSRLYWKVRQEKQREIGKRYDRLKPFLNERSRRLWAANESWALGRGGVRAVAEALAMSPRTVIDGRRELERGPAGEGSGNKERQRRAGGGRKRVVEHQPEIVQVIESIVDPATRGDPMAPLKWSSKSLNKISAELQEQGWSVSPKTIGRILYDDLKYSLQGLQKSKDGTRQHPDRDQQFQYLSRRCREFQERFQPVISVDAKKKELIGDFKNGGREYHPQGEPEKVRTHDFEDKQLGKGIPYGVYDTGRNEGWVSVGVDHDTAQFAVSSIRNWWHEMGQKVYPRAQELLITADAGGSNGYRVKLWKRELQKLANETGLRLVICHFPPGTSKWNKVEHRMFCHITANWRGRPLSSLEVIVHLIAGTKTQKGLNIQAAVDMGSYEKGIEVTDDEMAQVHLTPEDFHGEWNYTIAPMNSVHEGLTS